MKNRIKEIRIQKKLTQAQFGEKIGVRGNTITNYETGLRTPTDAIIKSICREFNVNEEWLRSGTGEMFKATPSDELDALAVKYNLTHRDYVFIEYLLKDVSARQAMERFCIRYASAILADGIPEDTPAMPGKQNLPLNQEVSDLEEEYKKSRSGTASKTDLSASNTTEEKPKKKQA